MIISGKEYCAIVLSTSEPLNEDGSPIIDSSKSLCNPYVFNTANTRAESLVVAVGNPFLLLKTENHMVEQYGTKAKCWSKYIKHCIERNSFIFTKSLEGNKKLHIDRLKKIVEDQHDKPIQEVSCNQYSLG